MTTDDSVIQVIGIARRLTAAAKGQPLFEDIPEATAPYYRFLYFLTRIWQTQVAVELGVYKGHSLAHIARGNPAATVVGVDRTLEHVNRKLLPANVRLVQRDSVEFLRHWPEMCAEPINLLHLDTEHTVEQIERELELALPLMSKPGIVCIDDVFANAELQQWWYRRPQVTVTCLELHSTGYGVMVV